MLSDKILTISVNVIGWHINANAYAEVYYTALTA